MEVKGKTVVGTGGGGGSGKALCRRLAAESGRVAVADLKEERFLILPHPEVESYRRNKAADYDRWINGMRRLRARIIGELGTTDVKAMHKLL